MKKRSPLYPVLGALAPSAVVLCVVGSLAGAFGGACSSSQNTTPQDGGYDATSDFDGDLTDAAPESSCETIGEWQQTCLPNDACAMQILNQCSQIDSSYSAGALQALEQCYADATSACGSGDAGDPTDLVEQCFQQELTNVLPTATQLKLANDYCARCDAKNPGCGGGFYEGAEASAGVGIQYLAMSDTIVQLIDTNCTAGTFTQADGGATCIDTFSTCATSIYLPRVPALSCAADAGKDASGP